MFIKLFCSILIVFITMGKTISDSTRYSKSDKVVQIDVSAILNARSVTTLSKGNLITWTTGIDKENGYLTMAAALFAGDHEAHALPDDPLFPASRSHPEILLHYSNEAGAENQTRCLADTGEFIFKVPVYKYSDLFLSLTSSYGESRLQIELTYSDGIVWKNFTLPDWYRDIPENDSDLSYVAHNRGKWGANNNLNEKDHHNIDALNIHPDSSRNLIALKLRKLPGGYLVFWAATGVVKN